MNGFEEARVAIRPMRREDVDALAAWGRHDDPRFRAYDVGPLTPGQADALWRALSTPAKRRRPYVAILGDRIVGQIVLRPLHGGGTAELGIMVDPALIGRGLGRRILRVFAGYCATKGLQRLTLEVMADNERAIRAYRAAGFVACDERTAAPYAGAPVARIIRMETDLLARALTESQQQCEPR
jgi:RimJ/RimL family protein N-acetyltransferase